jgi:hypothetical protein
MLSLTDNDLSVTLMWLENEIEIIFSGIVFGLAKVSHLESYLLLLY